ncbi:hypothetical protein MNBD_GAMMA14-2285 [hydrothermal vent metagenome]|uniref:Multidrug transporter n=1 Tax=hydrothermal vent metagenome TaxID=652676 RepID=A0A3B0Z7N1_9ZZZZ
MRMIRKKFTSYVMAGALALAAVSLPVIANAGDYAFDNPNDAPTGGEMLADAFMVRPLMVVGTVLTTAAFIVTLPFSAIGGNVDEAADRLVKEPARYTFTRPLGQL